MLPFDVPAKPGWEIYRLRDMLLDAGVTFEMECYEIGTPLMYLFYPGKKADGPFGWNYMDGVAYVCAYPDRPDALLYRGTIFEADWDVDGDTAYINAHELTAEDVFPLWWADWLYRQEAEE